MQNVFQNFYQIIAEDNNKVCTRFFGEILVQQIKPEDSDFKYKI